MLETVGNNLSLPTFFHLINTDNLISSKEAISLLELISDDVKLKHDRTDTVLLAIDIKIQGNTYSFYVVSKSNMFNLARVCVFDCYGKQVWIDNFTNDIRGIYQLVNIKQLLSNHDYQAVIDNSLTGKSVGFAVSQTKQMIKYLQDEFSI